MAELFNLIPGHGIFSARRQHADPSAANTHVSHGPPGRSVVLLSPVTYIHHSLDSLRHITKATVIPKWPSTHESEQSENDRLQNHRLARLSRLEDELKTTTNPRMRRRIEKEMYPLRFDLEAEAERRATLFDVGRVKSRLATLESARDADDLPRMLSLVRNQVSRDLGGMCNPKLYDRPGVRTQPVIDRYQKTVAEVLDKIVAACRNDDSRLDKHVVEDRLRETCVSFGRTALLCSGGGTMGMIHIGVIKALFEANRLPRIVCGSSAGAIVCAILCTRTEIELSTVLQEFCDGDLDVFVGSDETPLARLLYMWQNWCYFDSGNLKRVMQKYLGNMTFLEAYSRSGKVLNITVSSLGTGSASVRVLNYKNSADVVIWSAVVASCALPGVFKPANLFTKDSVTKAVTPLPGEYRDGSIQGDIPIAALTGEFGCSYFIVAQANPHVLAYQQMRQMLGTGVVVNSLEKLCSLALEEYAQLLPWSRLGWMGELALGVMRQSYTGDVTIVPGLTLNGVARVLTNPTKAFIEASTSLGESLTAESLPMIKNHLKIELALYQAYRDVKEAAHFGSSQRDLRRTMQQQRRVRPRRFGSTQSMPGLQHTGGHLLANLQSRQQNVGDQSSDNSLPHKAKFEIDSDMSDELDADSMTSLTPPADAVDLDSDGDVEPDLVIFQCYSAPASPRPTSLLGSPVQARSRSPAMAPFSLVMTPAKAIGKKPDRTDDALHSGPSDASLNAVGQSQRNSHSPSPVQSLRGRKRSSSVGNVGFRL